jgi:hypothetical protein
MNRGKVIMLYGRYYDILKRLGKISLTSGKKPTIEDVDIPKAELQRAYKEMKKLSSSEFRGDIIDYLCWISTKFILLEVIDRGRDFSWVNYYQSNTEDCNNMMLLFWRSPEYLLTEEIENRVETFRKIAELRLSEFLKK